MISGTDILEQDALGQRSYGGGQLSNTPCYIIDINRRLDSIDSKLNKLIKELQSIVLTEKPQGVVLSTSN